MAIKLLEVLGIQVSGVWFRDHSLGLGFGVWGLGFGVWGLGSTGFGGLDFRLRV